MSLGVYCDEYEARRSERLTIQPIDQLRQEHRTIEQLLGLLERLATRLETRQDVPMDLFPDLLEFLLTFADTCHHGKEEDILFPALENHGVAHNSGPIGVMLAEHDLGRRYVNTLAEAARHYVQNQPGSSQLLAQSARGYVGLQRQHIYKEDTILYPMASALLSEDEFEAIGQQFEALERDRLGVGEHDRLQQVAEHLATQLLS